MATLPRSPRPHLEAAWRDVRYARRVLARAPAFTLTALVTLALAIGVNTAVFALVNAVLLEPLPYPHPDRLALLSRTARAGRPHFVWGISVSDPLTFGGVAVLLLAVATVASVAPALRILRLDPATTLRQE